MRFKDLSQSDKDLIIRAYEVCDKEDGSRADLQDELSDRFDVSTRTIRDWANTLEVGLMTKNITNPSKILVYDIETCQIPAKVWWAGKQYINYKQLLGETKIITVAWKWLGDDSVSHLAWDKNHSDEKLMEEFLKVYNKADMVIGYNNDSFDNRLVNTRAMKYGLEVNTFVRSFDIMKESKRLFRLPSYALAYLCQFLGVTLKQSHEGIHMWNMIEDGTPDEQAEYLQKMVDYNVGDIVSTEEAYMKVRKYMGHKLHFGVLNGDERFTCPSTGSNNVRLYKRTATPAGTVQIIMEDIDTGVKYKITNKQYMSFLDFKMKQ